jgi:hypothetical protein
MTTRKGGQTDRTKQRIIISNMIVLSGSSKKGMLMLLLFIVILSLTSHGFLQSSCRIFTARSPTTTSSSSPPSNVITLHDIPSLFNNLLTQSPDNGFLVEHSQRIVMENGMQITVEQLANSQNYVQAATTLFVNMLTPASILAAAMISLGLKAPFAIPTSIGTNTSSDKIRHVESLRRTYIVVTLISFCSELLAVMWATVAVNQLTERSDIPVASSVWELLQQNVDLEWAAVNSHFVLGLIGFMYMVGLRGYVMLLEAQASDALIGSVLSGVGAALLLMVSIVNRGVESGGGHGLRYGQTVLDLFAHYLVLLYQRALGNSWSGDGIFNNPSTSVGPLGLGAILLEIVSVMLAAYTIIISPVVTTTRRDYATSQNPADEEEGINGVLVNGIKDRNVIAGDKPFSVPMDATLTHVDSNSPSDEP